MPKLFEQPLYEVAVKHLAPQAAADEQCSTQHRITADGIGQRARHVFGMNTFDCAARAEFRTSRA
jgi:hypothetical protein